MQLFHWNTLKIRRKKIVSGQKLITLSLSLYIYIFQQIHNWIVQFCRRFNFQYGKDVNPLFEEHLFLFCPGNMKRVKKSGIMLRMLAKMTLNGFWNLVQIK